ncbi:cAMP-dependent protein kinase [Besnoitia besnoiti]|uniref:cAMP-dependent protein kinase n=1 Tax=Besnoitia besnoiti TaxID=94643 RepID=A0A2A9M1S9_BESBE|nr:cAMP-dependent protein kinase [Besnoitia besnoiti]PFH31919.1 cAMP-dependent protein kinase [Besnoitia besnoiti]
MRAVAWVASAAGLLGLCATPVPCLSVRSYDNLTLAEPAGALEADYFSDYLPASFAEIEESKTRRRGLLQRLGGWMRRSRVFRRRRPKSEEEPQAIELKTFAGGAELDPEAAPETPLPEAPLSRRQRLMERLRSWRRSFGGAASRARSALGQGWRRVRTGLANMADRFRGRFGRRTPFRFTSNQAPGQAVLAFLATSLPVKVPEGEILDIAREAQVGEGTQIKLVSATTGAAVDLTIGEALGSGDYSAVFAASVQNAKTDIAVKIFFGNKEEQLTVAATEARVLDLVGLKDPEAAMQQIRIVAPIDTLVYPEEATVDAAKTVTQFLLVPRAAVSLLSITRFLRSEEAETFDKRALTEARLAATVQTTQLLAALHSSRLVHGLLDPKSFLLFSDGLFYLSNLGHARRHGERLVTSKQSRYSAPEVFEDQSTPYTYSRDAFPLGVILYELWCGRLPFNIGTPGVDSSEKVEVSHPATVYASLQNLAAVLTFEQCSPDMPLPVQNLLRKFMNQRRWARLLPQAALDDADFQAIVEMITRASSDENHL